MISSTEADYLLSRLNKGERTRLRIISGAIRCFASCGFEGATISELSRSVGVPRALFGHYFGGKEALIEECLKYVGMTGRARTQEIMQSLADVEDPVERYIRATFQWMSEFRDHSGYLILCLQRSYYDQRCRKGVHAIFTHAWSGIAQIVTEGVAAGRYRRVPPLDTARQIHALLVGLLLAQLLTPEEEGRNHADRCIAGARLLLLPVPT